MISQKVNAVDKESKDYYKAGATMYIVKGEILHDLKIYVVASALHFSLWTYAILDFLFSPEVRKPWKMSQK